MKEGTVDTLISGNEIYMQLDRDSGGGRVLGVAKMYTVEDVLDSIELSRSIFSGLGRGDLGYSLP